MEEDLDPAVSIIELQEEFLQHMEQGRRRIRTLALVATLAGGYFALNYFLQLVVLPFVLGETSQTVNLLDPGLMVLEAVSLVVALLWFVYGLKDLSFQNRLARQIREIRKIQAKAGERYGLKK